MRSQDRQLKRKKLRYLYFQAKTMRLSNQLHFIEKDSAKLAQIEATNLKDTRSIYWTVFVKPLLLEH